MSSGGKVLIPVFALGRAQELCLLLDSYWERMNLSAPIYFSAGMAEKVYTSGVQTILPKEPNYMGTKNSSIQNVYKNFGPRNQIWFRN